MVLVALDQAHERVDLLAGDVLLEELAVGVEQGRDGLLGEHVVADMVLHEAELLGDVLLVLAVGLLRVLEDAVAQAEDLLQAVLGLLQLAHRQAAAVAVLHERVAQHAEHLGSCQRR